MVRRSSRSVMAAQWGTGKMPGGGVKVDRSCTARQRQPECYRHHQNPTLLPLSHHGHCTHTHILWPFLSRCSCCISKADRTVSMLRPWDRPAPRASHGWRGNSLATGLPLMLAAEHHAVRMGVWRQARDCASARSEQSPGGCTSVTAAQQSRLLPVACKPPHCGHPCPRPAPAVGPPLHIVPLAPDREYSIACAGCAGYAICSKIACIGARQRPWAC
jgi:hypothetical protein